jgi:hypothetical protein
MERLQFMERLEGQGIGRGGNNDAAEPIVRPDGVAMSM